MVAYSNKISRPGFSTLIYPNLSCQFENRNSPIKTENNLKKNSKMGKNYLKNLHKNKLKNNTKRRILDFKSKRDVKQRTKTK